MAGTAVVVYLSEKKNCDCATSFLEIYVKLYDFEKNCGQMNKAGLKFVIQTEKPIIMIPLM